MSEMALLSLEDLSQFAKHVTWVFMTNAMAKLAVYQVIHGNAIAAFLSAKILSLNLI